MKRKASYAEIRLILGLTSVGIGLFAANLALFHWVEQTGVYHLLGEYAKYVCAYGGFGAMIFGSMLINDFLIQRRRVVAREDLSRFLVDLKAAREKNVVRKTRK